MAAYTENFGLHQWVPEDDFLRSDFNADFAKIDQALAAALTDDDLTDLWGEALSKCRLYFGAILGNGAASRVVDIGVEPIAVLITNTETMATVMFTLNNPVGPLTTVDNGFQVGVGGTIPQNVSGTKYCYFCLK